MDGPLPRFRSAGFVDPLLLALFDVVVIGFALWAGFGK